MISEQEIDKLVKELKEHFDIVFDYLGDENYVSTCNSEYLFGQSEFVMTDGVMNVRLNKYNNITATKRGIELSSTGVEVTTSFMGAKWIIIVDTDETSNLKYDLRLDKSKLTNEVKEEILTKLKFIKDNYDELVLVVPEDPVDNHMEI